MQSVGLGLALGLVLTYVAGIAQAARLLDEDRATTVSDRDDEIGKLKKRLEDPAESHRQELANALVAECVANERIFLKWVATCGWSRYGHFSGSGVPHQECSSALGKARNHNFIEDEYSRGMDVVQSRIKPDLVKSLLVALNEQRPET
jgi:hypothetical protein